MTKIHLALAGLISTTEEGEDIRFISKVFLTSIHIHELVESAKDKHEQKTEKVRK